MDLHLIILGFIVAALIAITGVGGGSLMAPALILGFGIAPPVAVGTDLIYAAVTKAGAVWIYARQKRVRWKIAGLMLVGSIPTALAASAGLWVVRNDLTTVNHIVSLSLGIALSLSAVSIAFNEQIKNFTQSRADRQTRIEKLAGWVRRNRSALAIVLGVIVGLLVTLSSVGGGAVGVAALMLLFPSIEPRDLVGTDIAYSMVLAATAGASHFLMLHNIDFTLLGSLLIGMIPGVYVGGLLSNSLPQTILRRVISVALIGAAVKLLAV